MQHMKQHEAMLNPQGQQQDMIDNPQQTMDNPQPQPQGQQQPQPQNI